jgi:hypothetical protein
MVQTVTLISERSSHILGLLEAFWGLLPEVANTIASWGDDEQLDFVMDQVPSRYNLLLELTGYADTGHLTPEQQQRYLDLRKLVERNQPYLENVRAWWTGA